MKNLVKSLEEMANFARGIFAKLEKSSQSNQATILALQGDLGSGKTAFVKALAEVLGIKEIVTSPTFVIEKIYTLEKKSQNTAQSFSKLIHIDAYRLDRPEELAKLGWAEICANPKNLICIEWPERLSSLIPSDALHLRFTFIDEQTREIVVVQ